MDLAGRFAAPADQAWLRLWVGLYGGGSQLARYLAPPSPERAPCHEHRSEPVFPRRVAAPVETAKRRRRHQSTPPLEDFSAIQPEDETVTILNRRSLASVLADAPLFFATIRALRRIAPDEYELFRRIGCVLPPFDDSFRAWGRIAPNDVLPAFAAFISPGKYWTHTSWKGHEHEQKKVSSIFIYKRVLFTGAYVPWGDVVYEWMHVSADLTSGQTGGHAAYIGVERATGRVKVLAQPTATRQMLRRGEVITHARVGVPQWVREHFQDQLDNNPDPDRNLHDWAGSVLSLALSCWRAADNGWQVHISDPLNVAMRLCIPERSAKVFFRDREAPDGGRLRPIFHIVGEHPRVLPSGREIMVREHYRGNREFTWNGYRTLITVPDHHHGRLSSFETDAVKEDQTNERALSLPQVGSWFAAHVRRLSPFHSYRRGY